MLKPELVMGENNKICMQVTLGQYVCTLPLPEHLAGADEPSLQQFFEAVVPEITANLKKMASKDRRKKRRQAK